MHPVIMIFACVPAKMLKCCFICSKKMFCSKIIRINFLNFYIVFIIFDVRPYVGQQNEVSPVSRCATLCHMLHRTKFARRV